MKLQGRELAEVLRAAVPLNNHGAMFLEKKSGSSFYQRVLLMAKINYEFVWVLAHIRPTKDSSDNQIFTLLAHVYYCKPENIDGDTKNLSGAKAWKKGSIQINHQCPTGIKFEKD